MTRMDIAQHGSETARNVALYPWFKFFKSLIFWQAIWFLFFQNRLSAGEAILLYAIYDIGTTVLEVPSGYMSDRMGRRFTLIASMVAGIAATVLLAVGDGFLVFALAQVFLGASAAFASGTDSALLYESLAATGRQSDIERQEIRAWRFSFTALAVSRSFGRHHGSSIRHASVCGERNGPYDWPGHIVRVSGTASRHDESECGPPREWSKRFAIGILENRPKQSRLGLALCSQCFDVLV